jgi:PST family polysaccharide transporter
MIRQGMNLVGYSLSEYFGRSAQRVAIGRGVGARVLGLYQNALQIYENIFMLLISSLHSVAVSGLSKLIDDPREFKRAWANGLSMVAFYAMPIYGALAVTGQDLVVILLGPKWSDSGYLLSIFAVRGIPQALLATTGWLYVSSARTDRWMRWGWFASLTQLVALLIAIPFGTNVIAAAYSASMIILLLPGLAYAGKPLGLKISDYVAVVWQPFTACAVATVCCLCLRIAVLSHSTHLARFSFLVTSYAIVYLLVAVGVLRVFKPLQILRSLLRDAVPRLFPRPAAN